MISLDTSSINMQQVIMKASVVTLYENENEIN
jgi:hypothetical protein